LKKIKYNNFIVTVYLEYIPTSDILKNRFSSGNKNADSYITRKLCYSKDDRAMRAI